VLFQYHEQQQQLHALLFLSIFDTADIKSALGAPARRH
jgi:hypothetical protein